MVERVIPEIDSTRSSVQLGYESISFCDTSGGQTPKMGFLQDLDFQSLLLLEGGYFVNTNAVYKLTLPLS